MKVLCYGDSNTYGYDPRSYFGGRYDKSCRWVDILAEKTGWEIINNGENGRRIPVNNEPFHNGFDLIILMLGTNDLLQGCTAEETACKMGNYLNGLSGQNILLIAPPLFTPGAWIFNSSIIEESEKLIKCYRLLAEQKGIDFADSSKWNVPLAFDGVHFTEEGHLLFAEGLYQYLTAHA